MHYYIHIPFCRQKCPYCKFALTPVFDEFKKKRYIEYLKKEIRGYFLEQATSSLSSSVGIKTIYFGGGTPSVLSLDEAQQILDCFPERDKDCELTFECNPEDITTDYIAGLITLGINRISIGVQSLNNETLSTIHRSDESTIFSALDCIKTALESHKNLDISVNVDFILGLPHVERGETLENIQRLHTKYQNITHTSVYILEKGLYPKSWKSHTLDDSLIQDEFMDILDYFESLGWSHYELSNWARSGYESRHNQSYWDHSDTRGFGLSAASYIAPRRFSNSESFSGYYKGELIEEEVLTPEQIGIENLMFGLRTARGYEMGGLSLVIDSAKLDEFVSRGLLIREKKNIKLTKTGIFLVDYIMSELIS